MSRRHATARVRMVTMMHVCHQRLLRDTSMHPGQWSSLWQTSLVFATVRHPLTRAVRSFERGSAAVQTAAAALGTPVPAWEEFCHDPLVCAVQPVLIVARVYRRCWRGCALRASVPVLRQSVRAAPARLSTR